VGAEILIDVEQALDGEANRLSPLDITAQMT
jgi:hypothetical protein